MLFSLLVQVFLGDVAIRKDMYENIVLCAGLIVLTVVTNAATYNYSNVHVFSSVATTSSNVGFYLSADSTSHPGGTAQPARLALTPPASCLSLLATPDLLSLCYLLSVSSRLFDFLCASTLSRACLPNTCRQLASYPVPIPFAFNTKLAHPSTCNL